MYYRRTVSSFCVLSDEDTKYALITILVILQSNVIANLLDSCVIALKLVEWISFLLTDLRNNLFLPEKLFYLLYRYCASNLV